MKQYRHYDADDGPQTEYIPRPELEYGFDPAREYAALPPEFDQHTYARAGEEKDRKRSLRRFLAVPALMLLAFLCFQPPLSGSSSAAPAGQPADTPPAQQEPQLPAVPEGDVRFDVRYAVRDSTLARYDYMVYKPDLEGPEPTAAAGDTPWPILVYARVTDEAGRSAVPEYDPDEWLSSRALNEYTIDITGLEGPLTLTLEARYTQDGEERRTVAELPLPDIPDPPETEATLSLDGSGEGSFEARVIPASPDAYPEGLEPTQFWLMMYNEAGESMGGFMNWTEDAMPAVTVEADGSVTASYAGEFPLEQVFFDAASLSARVLLQEPRTGYVYDVESNRVPVPEPAPETWPLRTGEEGKFVLTVYNDTTTFDVPSPVQVEDSPLTVLWAGGMPEEGFTEYALPEPIVPDGYRFAGWVVQVGNPFDFGSDTDLFEQYEGDPPVSELITEGVYAFPVGDPLTKADVERVPPREDGVRYVNVHATWIKEEVSDPRLFLDDGMGNVTAYDMIVPLASEGYLFLCNYPVPERPGYVFDGWYDENGSRVDLLVCYFSFTPMEYDSAGNFTGYNWNEKSTVTLTAHWKPE